MLRIKVGEVHDEGRDFWNAERTGGTQVLAGAFGVGFRL